jgi:hypothetical protein
MTVAFFPETAISPPKSVTVDHDLRIRIESANNRLDQAALGPSARAEKIANSVEVD